MGSKYGRNGYNVGPYSYGVLKLEGAVSFSMPGSARFGRSRLAIGSISVAPAFGANIGESDPLTALLAVAPTLSGRLYRVKKYVGALPMSVNVAGNVYESDGFRTTLPLNITLSAILSRPTPQELVGHITVPINLDGPLRASLSMVGVTIDINTFIGGGDTIEIEYFWAPADPGDDVWTSAETDDTIWVPI